MPEGLQNGRVDMLIDAVNRLDQKLDNQATALAALAKDVAGRPTMCSEHRDLMQTVATLRDDNMALKGQRRLITFLVSIVCGGIGYGLVDAIRTLLLAAQQVH